MQFDGQLLERESLFFKQEGELLSFQRAQSGWCGGMQQGVGKLAVAHAHGEYGGRRGLGETGVGRLTQPADGTFHLRFAARQRLFEGRLYADATGPRSLQAPQFQGGLCGAQA